MEGYQQKESLGENFDKKLKSLKNKYYERLEEEVEFKNTDDHAIFFSKDLQDTSKLYNFIEDFSTLIISSDAYQKMNEEEQKSFWIELKKGGNKNHFFTVLTLAENLLKESK